MTLQVAKGVKVVPGVERWLPAPSRVLSCGTWFKNWERTPICYTDPVGTGLFLRSVRVQVFHDVTETLPSLWFKVRAGHKVPVNLGAMQQWDEVLPLRMRGELNWWIVLSMDASFTWSMRFPYYTVPIRFGVEVEHAGNAFGYISASFEVEEIGA